MNTFRRIGLWFGSLLLAVMLFSFFYCLLTSQVAGTFYIFRITMMLALPVWVFYLPLVVALKDAEERRIWIILVSGILIGPTYLALWGLVLQLRGGDAHEIWIGDGLTPGYGACTIFALVVGFLTTAFYVSALKVIHRRLYAVSMTSPNNDLH